MGIKDKILQLFNTKNRISEIPESTITTMKEKIEQIEDENIVKPSDIIKEETIGAVKNINNPDKQEEVLESIGEKMEQMDVSETAISNAFEKLEQDEQISNQQVLKLFNGFSDDMKKSIIDKYLDDIHEKDNFSFPKEMIKTLEDDDLKEDALKKLSEEEKIKEKKLEEQTISNLEKVYSNIDTKKRKEFKLNDAEIEKQIKQAVVCKINTEDVSKAKLKVVSRQSALNYIQHGSNFLSHFSSIIPPKVMFKYVDYFSDNIINEFEKIERSESDNLIQMTPKQIKETVRNDVIKLVKNDEKKQSENIKKMKDYDLKNNLDNFRVELLYRRSPKTIDKISAEIKQFIKFSEEEMDQACSIFSNLGQLKEEDRKKALEILNQTIEKYVENQNKKEMKDENER